MSLTDSILQYSSLSIVGLEKNTGKTESLNYILKEIKDSGKSIAITSIGIDGESCDQVTGTEKPEITVYEGMQFVTSEKHYKEREVTSIVEEVSERQTALGRLVTAKALNTAKVLLSGPADTLWVKQIIASLHAKGVELVIVDGALSRKSLGAPTVTEAMVLATGAAVSANIPQLVRKTKYIYDLIGLEEVDVALKNKLSGIDSGIWAIDEGGEAHNLEIASSFMFTDEKKAEDVFRYGYCLYVAGAVGDKFMDFLRRQQQPVELMIRDFTRVFAVPEVFYAYQKSGKKLRVLERANLLAICVNPQSPDGFILDSETLCHALQKEVAVPVIDVRKTGNR